MNSACLSVPTEPVKIYSPGRRPRVGILTGGGDCPGLNGVIRASCLTVALGGGETIGLIDGFEGLYSNQIMQLSVRAVGDILNIGGTILGTTNVGHYTLPLSQDTLEKSKETYKSLELDCLICIGGDGTMSVANSLSEHCGINVIGVPKTIDNDLASTDQTFGFDSAVSVVTEALDRLHTTASSHHRAMIVEVMGRNAGWIALSSGLAGNASVILLPEIEWSWEPVLNKLKERNCDTRYCLVVVSEGTKLPEDEELTGVSSGKAFRLGGIGARVADEISKRTGIETRVTVLGHTQRGGSPTSYDRILATKFGVYAGELALKRDYGKMVSLQGTQIVSVSIVPEMQIQKVVQPKTEQMVHCARRLGIVFGDETTKK